VQALHLACREHGPRRFVAAAQSLISAAREADSPEGPWEALWGERGSNENNPTKRMLSRRVPEIVSASEPQRPAAPRRPTPIGGALPRAQPPPSDEACAGVGGDGESIGACAADIVHKTYISPRLGSFRRRPLAVERSIPQRVAALPSMICGTNRLAHFPALFHPACTGCSRASCSSCSRTSFLRPLVADTAVPRPIEAPRGSPIRRNPAERVRSSATPLLDRERLPEDRVHRVRPPTAHSAVLPALS